MILIKAEIVVGSTLLVPMVDKMDKNPLLQIYLGLIET